MNRKEFIDKNTDPQISAIFAHLPPAISQTITRERVPAVRAMADAILGSTPFESDICTRTIQTVSVGEASVEVVIYGPTAIVNEPTPAVLWIHGGGFFQGTAKDDKYILPMIEALNCPVISVEYRMAPEHPYPLPLDDCMTAYQWVLNNAVSRNIDTSKIAIAGISAGGGLTAGLCLKIRDEDLTAPALQVLRCPMLDNLHDTPSGSISGYPLWDRQTSLNGWEMYLGGTPGLAAPAYAAPARATNHEGLPPTYIAVGAMDLFRDENIAYAQKLWDAGVPVELNVFPGVVHGAEAICRNTDIVKKMDAQLLHNMKAGLCK